MSEVTVTSQRVTSQRHSESLFDQMLVLGVVSLTFGDIPYLYAILGGISMQGGAYTFVPAIILLSLFFIFGKQIHFPISGASLVFILFVCWLLVTVFANFGNIIAVELLGRSGLIQLMRQSAVLIIGFMTTVFVFNRCIGLSGREAVEKGIVYSAVLTLPVGLLQFLAQLDIPFTREISIAIGAYFREADLSAGGIRLSGFKPEPSIFGVWVAFIFPYLMAAWLLPTKLGRLRRFLAVLAAFLIIVSNSRTAVGVFTVQIVLAMFIAMAFGDKLFRNRIKVLFPIFLALLVSFTLIFSAISQRIPAHINVNIFEILSSVLVIDSGDVLNPETSPIGSNVTRLGAQLANVTLGIENLAFGVGFSQSPFYTFNYFPLWAESLSEERDPFSSVGIHARIFAETGAIGVLLWFLFWLLLIYGLFKKCRKEQSSKFFIEPLILFLIGVGLFLGGFSHDSFSYFEYWVYFGIALAKLKSTRLLARTPSLNSINQIKVVNS